MLDGMRRNASSWIIKLLFAIIILVFVFTFGTSSMTTNQSSIVAYVNDQPLLTRDYQRLLQQQTQAFRQQMEQTGLAVPDDLLDSAQFRMQVLDQMINDTLIAEEIDRLGLFVSPDLIRAQIMATPAFHNAQNLFDQSVYERVLRSVGLLPAAYEADVARSLRIATLQKYLADATQATEEEAYAMYQFQREQATLQYVLFDWKQYQTASPPSAQQIQTWYDTNKESFERPALHEVAFVRLTPASAGRLTDITDTAISQYYQEHTQDFAQPEMVRARHILIQVAQDASEQEKEAARKRLLRIKSRITNTRSFASVAREYSQGPSAPQGGDLGWFSREAMVPAFSALAFSLEPGTVGGPVLTQFGWHLIQIQERKQAAVQSLEEAAPAIRTLLAEEQGANVLEDVLEQVIEQLFAGDSLEKITADTGLVLEKTAPLAAHTLAQRLGIRPEDAARITSLETGHSLQSPVTIDEGYLLATKTAHIPESIAPLDDVRETIISTLKRQEAMDKARQAAQQFIEQVTDTDTQKAEKALAGVRKTLQTTAPFDRQGTIATLGTQPELTASAFAASIGAWLPDPATAKNGPQPYTTENGVVVARLTDRIPPTPQQWQADKQNIMDLFMQNKQEQLYQIYKDTLREQAEINIADPSALE